MKYCPKCGKEYSDETNFCQQDRTPLEVKVELKKCPGCGAENPSTAKFCNECGESFNLVEYKCSECGRVFTDGSNFCNDCGGKVEEVTGKSHKEQVDELLHQIDSMKHEMKKLEDLESENTSLKNFIAQMESERNSLQQKFNMAESELQKYKDKEKQELLKKQETVKKQKIATEEDFVLLDKYKTPFYISKYQVTQELYEKVMGENPSHFEGARLPAESMSWYDAIYFCNLLSEMEGLSPVYKVNGKTNVKDWNYSRHNGEILSGNIEQDLLANGYRLPTEDEWQYAAKCGKNYEFSGSDKLKEVGWFDKNSWKKTHPVGEKKANDYGLYDMSGNVSEWCWDKGEKNARVLRGGSWRSGGYYCAVSCRDRLNPDCCRNNGGFRLVRSGSN